MGVNPKSIDDYTVLKWTNLTKLHIYAANQKDNTYSEELFLSNDCVSIWSWTPVKFMTSRETQELGILINYSVWNSHFSSHVSNAPPSLPLKNVWKITLNVKPRNDDNT